MKGILRPRRLAGGTFKAGDVVDASMKKVKGRGVEDEWRIG